MTATKPHPDKKPVNRKLATMAFVGLGVLMVFALIAVTLKDPRRAAEEQAAAAKQRDLQSLPSGSQQAGEREVAKLAKEAEEAAARKRQQEEAMLDTFLPPAVPGGNLSRVPPIDPRLLALDQAQREVMSSAPRPDSGAGGGAGGREGFGSISPTINAPGGGAFGAYEAYPSTQPGAAGESPERAQEAEQLGAAGFYETVQPEAPPSARVLTQGAVIPAVLVSRIDTRTAGPLLATVTRTVYDSPTSRIPLIPQGTRLVGRYESRVSPGEDRITALFERMVLPDGRAVALPDLGAGGIDGTAGLDGRFHSNILRAIGPSFVVALLGQALDNGIEPDTATSNGFLTQSPTVAQQVVPQINQAVLDRYSGARPYFTAAAGQEIRLILTADLEVPAPAGTGGSR